MKLKTKYITPDEFKQFSGIDLQAQLKSDDNPSNTAEALLYRIETRIAAYIDANFYRSVDYEFRAFNDYQKEHYKLALLEQTLYVVKNGDISVDSGYEPESGVIASRGQLKELSISENAKQHLMLCGLWSRKINARTRGGLGDWMY